jgi:hypothetical protein
MSSTIRNRNIKPVILGIVGGGGFISYVADDDQIRAKNLIGHVVKITPLRGKRNLKFHRKFFVLVNLGFEYWSPKMKLVSEPEEWIAFEVAKEFCEQAGQPELFEKYGKNIAQIAIDKMVRKRSSRIDPDGYKNIDNFRKRVMIKAGFYELVTLPNGGIIKQPWSIAFHNMTQEQFNDVYKKCFDVIWYESLFQNFENEQEVENLINQLLNFN